MNIIPRSQWGARPPSNRQYLSDGWVDTIVVHYTAMNGDRVDSLDESMARLRGVQRYHMDSNGWSDIGYHFAFDKNGNVFEARGFNVYGAHVLGHNGHTYGVVFLGAERNDRDDLTDAGREALVLLCGEIEKQVGRRLFIKGHKELGPTACPGDEIMGFINSDAFRVAVDRARQGQVDDAESRPWPIPLPKWWWAWASWWLQGRKGPRPDAPRLIPLWAWRRLIAFKKARKKNA